MVDNYVTKCASERKQFPNIASVASYYYLCHALIWSLINKLLLYWWTFCVISLFFKWKILLLCLVLCFLLGLRCDILGLELCLSLLRLKNNVFWRAKCGEKTLIGCWKDGVLILRDWLPCIITDPCQDFFM